MDPIHNRRLIWSTQNMSGVKFETYPTQSPSVLGFQSIGSMTQSRFVVLHLVLLL
jgi:hypothetical protein